YEDDNQIISGEFINDPTGTGFAVSTDDPDRDYFTAALGVSGQFTNNLAAFVQYERLLGHSYLDENVINGGVRLSF
ncbi:MAG: autotransporter domain-containing protein, partial [Gammaproteobacteria bacterium]|nr:autotransporter domain-containing protein [Gammaproteobacteria bacterium]